MCDKNAKILEWGSEESLPYISPHDRVFTVISDFYIKVQENTGKIKRYLIKVKPLNKQQNQRNKRQTKVTFMKHLNTQGIKQNGKQENIVLTNNRI